MRSPLDLHGDSPQEMTLDIDGARVPLSMAVAAVRRCTETIDCIDRLTREMGFASQADLDDLRAILAGQRPGDEASSAS